MMRAKLSDTESRGGSICWFTLGYATFARAGFGGAAQNWGA